MSRSVIDVASPVQAVARHDDRDRSSLPETVTNAFADGLGAAFDVGSLLVAAAMVVLLLTDSAVVVRPPIALVFALFVPGWTICRAFGAPASLVTCAGSIASSLATLIVLGQALVLFGDWKWFPASLLLASGCVVLGVRSHRRRWETSAPAGRADQPRTARITVLAIGSLVVGNALVALGVRRSHVSLTNLLGLFDTLSGWYWAGVAVIVAGLLYACFAGSRWAWANVTALLVALHGLPGMLEPSPRFSVAWLHAGFIRQISEHGTLLRGLDARFSWAGFFSGGGLLQRLLGTDSVLWLVRYAPLFYNTLTIMLIVCIARRLRATEMQSVVAATLFCCLNWIGQDYFAPQATAFVLYLSVVTVVLYAFPANPARAAQWVRTLLRPAPDDTPGINGRAAVAALAGCYLMVLAIVLAHQLTPGFLMMTLFLLALSGAIRVRLLPAVVAVMFLVWLSFGADAYWTGHFNTLTNSVGQVSSIVGTNVGKRTNSTVFTRQLVVDGRIALAVMSWALAGISIGISWFKRRTPVALMCMLLAPFPMIVLQPYGGEMVLRVCYFTLPAVVILIAQLFVPATLRVSARRIAVLAVAFALLVPAFVLTRYGNESFEAMSQDDARLNAQLYRVVPDGAVVFVASRQAPISSERIGEVSFRNLPKGTVVDVTASLTETSRRSPVFVMLSESQAAFGVTTSGRPPEWMSSLIEELLGTGRYRIDAQYGRGVLLELTPR